jgi:hypothetical protein
MLSRPVCRAAIAGLRDGIVELEGADGRTLYDVADGPVPDEDVAAPPRLLPMWDSILLAYADRSRIIPEEYRKRVIRTNGDVLPTLLVDGDVARVWRPVGGGIEATAFHELDAATWAGLDAEARSLVAFLADRDPLAYRRYRRWWTSLPAYEVRVIGG